nr:hypothetical protein BaRGS_020262 [Batillaria attramentaria]KAG5696226.1 hypothetical protein BaRGS_019928 [Batillaria attramentaria]
MKTSLYHLILTLLGPHCCLSLLVQPCPKTCTCDQDPTYSSGLRVNCSNADLLEVPWDIPVGTTTLLLRDNHFEILHNSSFASLTQLRTLDLSFNRIAHMEENAFEGLETLLLLDLRRNVLTLSRKTYLERVFQPLASLKTLFLNRNSYASAYRREPPVLTSQSHGTEINTSVTGHVKDKLELSNADLTYPDDALSHLHNLVELHLDGLKDTVFGPGFRNLSNLTVLSSQGFCHLGALDNTTFLNTPHVQQLNLSECDIIEVTRDAFSTLTDLRELDLSYNQKLGLDRLGDAFEGLSKTRLERLVIDAVVPIRNLGIIVNSTHLRHFKDLNHLKVVQARFNRIEAFDDGVLCTELPPNLKHVYLNANMLVLASYVNDLKCLESLELLHINGFDTYWTPPLRPPDPEDVRTRTKSCAKQVPGNGGTAEEAAA